VAFSSAKGLPIDWCKNADSGLPEPDLVIFLQAPIKVLENRGEYGNERYENI
jgi:dTMP kinase